ncbi:MAG: aminoglycoside phosphotransferase family protein [Caldilineaceae bacterium]
MTTIPSAFAQTILDLHQDKGADWLKQLPALLHDCAQRWGLTVGAPFSLSYNYVAPAERADGSAVVLKVGYPTQELRNEIEALRLYNGDGMVQLLDADPERGFLLLERLQPGDMLSTLADDEAATAIGAAVMKQLWRPAPAIHTFPSVADWAQGLQRHRARFDGGVGPLPKRLFEQAERLFQELPATDEPPMLLHGDLHHFNILRAQRRPWLAIDPKGLVGDPGYEVGAFLYNPAPELGTRPDLDQLLQRRVDQLAEHLHCSKARVRGWGIAQAVLSACWSIEEQGRGWEYTIDIGERLVRIKTA